MFRRGMASGFFTTQPREMRYNVFNTKDTKGTKEMSLVCRNILVYFPGAARQGRCVTLVFKLFFAHEAL